MNVLITGATGLIGSALVSHFSAPMVTSRDPARANAVWPAGDVLRWPLTGDSAPPPRMPEVIFHLAGEPVAGSRWSAARKARIRDSRVEGTRGLVDWIETLPTPPKVLVCASAIGFYGDRGDEELTEASSPGQGFLTDVCLGWEEEAARAASMGVRVVSARLGIVLSSEGGALGEMLTPFKLGVGGPLSTGAQWMSWIHIDDVVGLLRHAAQTELSGALNLVGPNPVRNEDFSRVLGDALGRPAFIRTPAFALRLALGEMTDIVLASHRVRPEKALATGYTFQYRDLREALDDCVGRQATR